MIARIPRYERYEFHSDGFVISHVKSHPKVMKPIRAGNYKALSLYTGKGEYNREYLHRLICEAFHGPCPDGMECRHLDGNKENNAASNLRWGTKEENERDKDIHGTKRYGEKNPMAKLTRQKVQEMKNHRAKTCESYKIIGEKFGVSTMTAFRAITGQSWREE